MQAPEFEQLIDGVRDLASVRRVYGDPYEKDGMTVIPAAVIRGRGGIGRRRGGREGSGAGGGLAMVARPSGAWVIRDGKVDWKPVVDVNRVVLGGQLVALAAILVAGARRRGRRSNNVARSPLARLVHLGC